MAVRPTFVEISVDGRKQNIATGPRSKDGGMTAQFYIRDNGSIAKSVRVECYSLDNGQVSIVVKDQFGCILHTHITEY